mmetsp:Transcript_30961/g.77747  ORF Transcript_30961/g.77747 Transcript_30961/m.77747 type:complete len:482 (-) Transcript_30961:177-1622(-)
MEELCTALAGDGDKCAALNSFIEQNESNTTFTNLPGGAEAKKKLWNLLMGIVNSDLLNTPCGSLVLSCMRLLLREEKGLEEDVTPEFIDRMLSLSYSADEKVAHEAAKCAVNLINRFKEPTVQVLCRPGTLLRMLECIVSNPTGPAAFPFVKVVFHLYLMKSHPQLREEMDKFDLLDKIAKCAVELGRDLDAHNSLQALTEMCRLLFQMTINLGPLGEHGPLPPPPKPHEVDLMRTLVPTFQAVLLRPKRDEWLQAQEAVVTCLINVPVECVETFDKEPTFRALLEFLQAQNEREAEDPSSLLTPVLLVLTSVCKRYRQAREMSRKFVFPMADTVDLPHNVEAPKEVVESGCLGSKLMNHMTSMNFALKTYVNEFLFECCDEDADELSRLVGFGRAAGLMATRSLFSVLNEMARKQDADPATVSTVHREVDDSVPPEWCRGDKEKEDEMRELAIRLERGGTEETPDGGEEAPKDGPAPSDS